MKDPLYKEAKKIVIEKQFADVPLLQRKLEIGFVRTVLLLNTLADNGVVGPLESNGRRKVLVPKSRAKN